MRSNKRRFLMLLSAGIIAWVVYCIISIASFNRHKTTPLRNIVNILPPSIRYLKVNDSSRIPVVIVEEHHEVIPYWYAAAEQSLITKSDVTILHIDGHDDNAYPIITEDFPLLKYPTTDIQLFSLMQRNDVFIVGASATGLIKRVIWVWPPWDKVNHKTDYKKRKFEIGKIKKKIDGVFYPFFCVCVLEDNVCFFANTSDPESSEIRVSRHQCDFTNSVIVMFELVSENKAIELVQSDSTWIRNDEVIILDIDEDYYGCESVVSELYRTNIDPKIVGHIETIINSVFCGSDVDDEYTLDHFFHFFIQKILQLNKDIGKCDPGYKGKCMKFVTIQSMLFQMIPTLLQQLNNFLCSDEAPVFLEALMRHLLKLTDLQLNITQTIGLCLTRSPNTLHFEPSMRFCVSYNDPNSTLVLFHTPSIQEIEKRTEKLLTLLSATVLPKFITVTRSVRDGYTPRHLAGKIETDIMQILNQKYHVLDHNLVHYDDSLLGGKKGWYNRYK